MNIKPREILRKLGRKLKDRHRFTLYLSTSIYQTFRKSCDDASPSQVLEFLMEHWIEAQKKSKADTEE